MSTKTILLHADGTWEYADIHSPPPGGTQPEQPTEVRFNSAAFFDYIRANCFWGSLNQSQVDGINLLGEYFEAMTGYEPKLQLTAYMFATFQWETASTMQPIEEYGGKNARYAPWYGRGFVQLTWEENYQKQQSKLADHPLRPADVPYQVHDDRGLALNPDTSALISIYGCLDGDFTGKKLTDYIKPGNVDYVNARRVVNGTDKQHEIAALAEHWEQALRIGLET